MTVNKSKQAYTEIKKTKFEGNQVYDFWPYIAQVLREYVKYEIVMVGSENRAWICQADGLPRGVVTMREG